MKYITCCLSAIIFCFVGTSELSASPGCDPAKPCNTKTNDTTAAKKPPVKVTATQAAAKPVSKPIAKKEPTPANGDFVSPLSWWPTFLY